MPNTRAFLLAVTLALPLAGAARADDASVIPFPFVFYTPETGLGGGGTVLVFRHTADPEVRPAIVSPVLVYTAKRQTLFFLSGEFYPGAGRWRLDVLGGYTKYPDTFWGLGNDSPGAAEEDFTSRTALAKLSLKRRVAPALLLGGRLEYAWRELLTTEPGGLLATAALPGVRDGSVRSVGLSVTHDDRDSTTYPRRGGFHDLVLSVSGGALGGDYDFRAASLELSQYRAVSASSVLALQILAEARSDAPPFDLLPRLGGDALLRGYFGGRYRDRNLLACQAEWRSRFWRRLGGAVFAAAGQVAHNLGDIRVNGFHAAGGVGLRFLLDVKEGLNLRADWGVGKGSSGLYMSLGEAF